MYLPPYLFRNKMTVKPFLGNSAYGPSYGIEFTTKCRVQAKSSAKVLNEKSQYTNVIKLLVLVPANTNIPLLSQATYQGSTYQAVEVKEIPSVNTISHIEVVLQNV